MKRLAQQVEHHPGLMAGLIAAYQRRHKLDDLALMRHLRVDADGLARLVLARRPRAEHKVDDVLSMARSSGCDTAVLWAIIATGEQSGQQRH